MEIGEAMCGMGVEIGEVAWGVEIGEDVGSELSVGVEERA